MYILALPNDLFNKIYNIVECEEEKESGFLELDSYVLMMKKSCVSHDSSYNYEPIYDVYIALWIQSISKAVYDRLYKSGCTDNEINEYAKSRGMQKYYKQWQEGE